jgi:hypothetical protein
LSTPEQCRDFDQETARIYTSGAFSGSREKIMAKRKEKQERRSVVLEPNAAGIDNGVEKIYVAVPDP